MQAPTPRTLHCTLLWFVIQAAVVGTAVAQPVAEPAPAAANIFDEEGFGGPQLSDSGVGYVDTAVLGSQLRVRYEAAYGSPQPARAEFVWPIDGPFGPGPGPETRVDYQDISIYLEHQWAANWSAFAEAPIRFLNPEIQDNTAGLADINAGVKCLLDATADSATTFQMRVYAPTGDGTRGIGTRHVSVEPALLMYRRWTDRLAFEGEVRDWISIGGTDGFAGNVLRYGLGGNYLLNPCDPQPLAVVVETVGWTVLDGGTAITTPVATEFTDATGDTIVNVKAGLRYGLAGGDSLYAGYGRVLTAETWYEDVFRVEWRRAF